MKCLRCGAAIELTGMACPACGASTDADGDGVPDALAKLIEAKARSLLQAERDDAAQQAREAARRAAEEQAAAELAALRRRLERAKESLAENVATPRRVWCFDGSIAFGMAVVSIVGGGVLAPACIEPLALNRSIVAGELLCPLACRGCRGPGRIFTWHESSTSYEGNVSTQLCHNPVVDIDRVRWSDVNSREDGDLAPYRLTLWTSVPIDAGLFFAGLFVFVPFWAGRWRRERYDRLRTLLEDEIERLEARLGSNPPVPPRGPFRDPG